VSSGAFPRLWVGVSGRLSDLQRVRAWLGQALKVGCRSSLHRVVAAWSVSASPVGGANQLNGRGEAPRQSRAAHPPGWSDVCHAAPVCSRRRRCPSRKA
jgi:hypothetical protein